MSYIFSENLVNFNLDYSHASSDKRVCEQNVTEHLETFNYELLVVDVLFPESIQVNGYYY